MTPDGWKEFDGVDAVTTQPRRGIFGFRRGETTTAYRFNEARGAWEVVAEVDNREGPLGLTGRTVERSYSTAFW